jgi:hypothetical protein
MFAARYYYVHGDETKAKQTARSMVKLAVEML